MRPRLTGNSRHSRALMDTVITIDLPGGGEDATAAVDRAFAWFAHVERVCSRFDPESEVVRLSRQVGRPVAVSRTLFEAVRFALALGRLSQGAFDPTVGGLMESRGFDENYRTGGHQRFADGVEPAKHGDIVLDDRLRTITLRRHLLIDLGAVAKGLAVDLAARELAPLADYSIDAGGDLYLAGRGPDLGWRVGIQHPRRPGALAGLLELTDLAVCTSGDYMRRGAGADEQHLVDPRTGKSPSEAASVTVVATSAMLADGLSTAAYVLGPKKGLALVSQSGAEGLVLTPRLEKIATPGMQPLLRDLE